MSLEEPFLVVDSLEFEQGKTELFDRGKVSDPQELFEGVEDGTNPALAASMTPEQISAWPGKVIDGRTYPALWHMLDVGAVATCLMAQRSLTGYCARDQACVAGWRGKESVLPVALRAPRLLRTPATRRFIYSVWSRDRRYWETVIRMRRKAWGKADGESFHSLAHHSMDVAAVFARMMQLPIIRNRMETAAEVQFQRVRLDVVGMALST